MAFRSRFVAPGLLLIAAGCGLVAACSHEVHSSPAAAHASIGLDGVDPDGSFVADANELRAAARDGLRSIDPSALDRSCSSSSECTLLDPITDCSTCCGAVGVRASAAQAALSALTCESWTACTMVCPSAVPACVSGRCEAIALPPDAQAPGGPRSVDPASMDRSCSVDTDCALVEPITNCSSCCGAVGVRASAADEAMRSLACETRSGCSMICPAAIPTCVSGQCEALAPDGG